MAPFSLEEIFSESVAFTQIAIIIVNVGFFVQAYYNATREKDKSNAHGLRTCTA